MPTLRHISDNIEYTIGYTYYRGNNTPEDPEDFEIIQIWDEHGDIISEDLFDQILSSCDMIELIKEDMKNHERSPTITNDSPKDLRSM